MQFFPIGTEMADLSEKNLTGDCAQNKSTGERFTGEWNCPDAHNGEVEVPINQVVDEEASIKDITGNFGLSCLKGLVGVEDMTNLCWNCNSKRAPRKFALVACKNL